MDVVQAFEVLGLPESASVEQIHARYRELAPDRHPDLGGDPRDWTELAEAHEVAIGARAGNALVPLVRDLARQAAEESERRSERRTAAQHSAERLIRRRTGTLKSRQRKETGFAVVAGGTAAILALLQQANAALASSSLHDGVSYAALASGFIAAVVALGSWMTHLRATMLRTAMDELNDILRDRRSFIGVAVELIGVAAEKEPELQSDPSDDGDQHEDTRDASGEAIHDALERFFATAHDLDEIAYWCSHWAGSWDEQDRPHLAVRRPPFVTARLSRPAFSPGWGLFGGLDGDIEPRSLALRISPFDVAELFVAQGAAHDLIEEEEDKYERSFRFSRELQAPFVGAVRRKRRG